MYKKLLLLYLVLLFVVNMLFSIWVFTGNPILVFGLFIAVGILGDVLKKRSGGDVMKRGFISIELKDIDLKFVLFNVLMIAILFLLTYAFLSLIV